MVWKDHLLNMDHLKEGIGLRGYGQRDPLVEYKRESLILFESMQERVRESILRYLFLLEPARPEAPAPRAPAIKKVWSETAYDYSGGDEATLTATVSAQGGAYGEAADPRSMAEGRRGRASTVKTVVSTQPKTGRNEPCPCGSGKKYKKCHGASAEAGMAG
jgi:preprotein translocase subunit SecA